MDERVAAYQTAVGLANHQGTFVWSSFSSLAQAHAIFIGLSGLLLAAADSRFPLIAVSACVAGFGILLCLLWILVLARLFDYYTHWFAWARQLEAEAYGETMRLLRSGRTYSEGEPVELSGVDQPLRMGRLANVARIRHLTFATVGVFVAIYLVILAGAIAVALP